MAKSSSAKLNSILGRMNDLEHQEVDKEFIGAFYGGPGTGKTTAAVALAQKLRGDGRILYLDSADGFVSLDNIPALKRNVDRIRVDDGADLAPLANAVRTRHARFKPHTVVILDEISSWYTDILHAYAREQLGIGPDEDLPEIEGGLYAAPQAALLNVIKAFHKTAGLHVIMVSHEQTRAIKGDREQKITLSLGPKLTASVSQLSHVIARFESRAVKEGYERTAQVWPTRYVEAKSRIGGLEVKMPVVALVKELAVWAESDQMAEDLVQPESQEVLEDEPEDATEEIDGDDEDFEVSDDEDDTDDGDIEEQMNS